MYQDFIFEVDLVYNLILDKQYVSVVEVVMLFMKKGVILGYFYGFNIVEEGQ